MKTTTLLFTLFIIHFTFGQGSETFESVLLPTSYATGSFIGDNSLTWNYTQSRNDAGYEITTEGIMLRKLSSNSKVGTTSVSGGIGNFTCKLKKAYTGAGNRQVELFINGVSKGTSIAWDNTTVQVFSVNNINISGNVDIEIRNITSKQVIIDDISWTGYTPNATDSDAIAPTTQIPAATISSIADTSIEAVNVFDIEIRDSGLVDILPTKVTSIKIKPAATNTADWTDFIQGLTFNIGAGLITPTSINITDNFIEATFNSGILIPDNDSMLLTIGVYLNTTNILDGKILSFMVDASDHGFTATNTGSTFVTPFPNGNFSSNDFTVDVDATELRFTQQPTNVEVQSVMVPAVTVYYSDENGNRDRDYNGIGATATLSATGATLISTTSGTPVNGILTFNDVEFSTTNTGVTLTITDSGNITNTTITSTTFDVTGEQEMEIEGANNGFIIVSGSYIPDEDHDTLFGTISTAGATFSQTYTIKNLGILDLNLTDPSPYINIGGINPGDFSVTVIPTTPIAGLSSVNFEITFDPSAAGLREAVINIANNDANESNYSFAIEGNGYDPCTQLFISEYANAVGGNYIEIYNPTNADVDMSNYKIWRALNGGAWSGAGTTDVISLSGTLASGNVYVVARDPLDMPFANKYDVDLDYNGDDNIGLAWNGGSGTTFTLIDSVGDENGDPGTGWTVAGTANATKDHTLVRKASVDYSNTNWDNARGTNAVDSEWIVLNYVDYTKFHHVSDCQQIPLMAISGYLPGTPRDLLVINEGLVGAQTPKASNNTLFEDQQVGVTTVSHTFRIYNAGNTDLNLNGGTIVEILGANASDFTVTANPTTPVAANNGFTSFTVTFNPTDYGVRTATVSIANDNPFENPYIFTIQGTGLNYTACNVTAGVDLGSESFEGSGSWTNTLSPATYDAASHSDVWAISNVLGTGTNTISSGSDGSKFFGMRDLNNNNGGSGAYHTIIFDALDISNNTNVVLSFDYYSHGYDGTDEIRYLVKYDNNTTWAGEVTLSKNTNAWTTVTVNVPANSPYIRLKLEAKQDGGNDWAAFDNIKLTGDLTNSTTWNGTVWSNGAPTATIKAIFDADYNTSTANIEACACQVNSGNTLTVAAGNYLLIETDLENNGIIEVAHEASIVQHKSDAVLSGAGLYKIQKTTPSYAFYDYTYWSSPIDNETIGSVFNGNEPSKIYGFTTANFSDEFSGAYPQTTGNPDSFDDDNDDWYVAAGATVMQKGVGYIAMGAGSPFPLSSPLVTGTATQSVVFDGGIINNGNITVNVSLDKYNTAHGSGNANNTNINLIGNPYPSAIDLTKLRTDSSNGLLEGTFYFWTHDDPIGSGANNGPDAYNFNNDDYSIATVGPGGVFSATASSNFVGSGAITASQYVASGQGFFANVNGNGTIRFTNQMRVVNENNHFLRPASNNQIDRVWLNLTKTDNTIFRQIYVGFHDAATDGFINGQDGARMANGSNTDFYSIIPNDDRRFAIQNLGTFNDTKTVNLGLEIIEDGTYTISIDHVEGIFDNNQTVYLEDIQTNTIHNLSSGAYTFNTLIGDNIDTRFTLRFTNTALSTSNNTLATNLIVAQNSTNFKVTTSDQSELNSVELFNLLGQKLGEYHTQNKTIQIPNSKYNNGTILILKATLANGSIITKKVIKQ